MLYRRRPVMSKCRGGAGEITEARVLSDGVRIESRELVDDKIAVPTVE